MHQSTSYPSGSAVDPSCQTLARQSHPQRNDTPPLSANEVPSTPRYDLNDEDNLPSPFLKRVERESIATKSVRTGSLNIVSAKAFATGNRRRSNGNALRMMAAANSANITNHISPTTSATNVSLSSDLGSALSAKPS